MSFASVTVDIEIDDYLEDASTEALEEELKSRKIQGRSECNAWRDWQMLADLIAQGEKAAALSLLSELSPASLHSPAAILLINGNTTGHTQHN